MTSHLDITTRALWSTCGVGLLLAATGCGSKLPVVSGTITLGGTPLPDATVMFMPKDDTQSPAQGITDAEGKYTLEQESSLTGIQPGEYSVRITTFQPGLPDVDPPIPTIKEKVPMCYNVESELNAVVGSKQTSPVEPFDYALEANGQIFQPNADSF